jgi:hypothetical protein
MEKLSPELEALLGSFFKLRKLLEPLLPKEAIDYIINLIAKDLAHRKFLSLVEEDDNGTSVQN